ncbi:hypothetical protein [Schumannella soli]|uniref:Uncharacterized protein n=1 Tax=Schumannella soli TaxID=2590779 RepID=A0A506Y9A2_9MICO|nr:hypothetical protein [Schumannella soli]TPW77648.1 hypothetical protein FJ657_03020 [Schumannella soli]
MILSLLYPYERHLLAQGGYRQVRDPRQTLIYLLMVVAMTVPLIGLFVILPAAGADPPSTSSTIYVWLIAILCPIWMVLWLLAAIFRSNRLARASTGTPLRRRHSVAYATGGDDVVADILGRFRTGDPARYAPLPTGVKNGALRVQIWTADADRLGFVAITQGIRHSELVTLDGPAYDRLAAALDAGIGKTGTSAFAGDPTIG